MGNHSSSKLKGVFLDAGSVDAGDIDFSRLEDCLDLTRHDHCPEEDRIHRSIDAEVLITNKCRIERSVVQALPRLRLICVAATGVDNVDLDAARERGIAVCNARNYATESVAEHALSLILALNGRLLDRHRQVRQGHWSESRHFALLDPASEELSGQTLGVIGYGQLGKALSARAKALGMNVMVAERAGRAARANREPFEQVLQSADVLSLHCPLTPDTENLINADGLARMPSNALLINTARGGLVNDSDLLDALKSGGIAGAGIDVLDSEPPPPDHPLLIADLPNLIVTPHCAWAARGARQRLIDQLAEVVSAFGAGELLNCVD